MIGAASTAHRHAVRTRTIRLAATGGAAADAFVARDLEMAR
jgi:hypothetical protein